jgi:hypothetical protein
MASYYVNDNAQSNGDHEVHAGTCSFLPEAKNRTYLGEHTGCATAVVKARTIYSDVDGCYWCSPSCHKS